MDRKVTRKRKLLNLFGNISKSKQTRIINMLERGKVSQRTDSKDESYSSIISLLQVEGTLCPLSSRNAPALDSNKYAKIVSWLKENIKEPEQKQDAKQKRRDYMRNYMAKRRAKQRTEPEQKVVPMKKSVKTPAEKQQSRREYMRKYMAKRRAEKRAEFEQKVVEEPEEKVFVPIIKLVGSYKAYAKYDVSIPSDPIRGMAFLTDLGENKEIIETMENVRKEKGATKVYLSLQILYEKEAPETSYQGLFGEREPIYYPFHHTTKIGLAIRNEESERKYLESASKELRADIEKIGRAHV